MYKRQDRDKARACLEDIERELTSAIQGRAGAKAALEGQEQDLSSALACLDAARAAYAASVIAEFQPVSYTHLDVYKRQV